MEKSSLFLILFLLSVTSCTDQPADALITEPAGSANYYINNQSLSDLRVIYIGSAELNFETDSTTVPRDSSTLIFTDGIIGMNPKPSDSFSSIRFFRTADLSAPALVIEPVENDDWNVISQERDNSGYGLTEYEFTVTDQILMQ